MSQADRYVTFCLSHQRTDLRTNMGRVYVEVWLPWDQTKSLTGFGVTISEAIDDVEQQLAAAKAHYEKKTATWRMDKILSMLTVEDMLDYLVATPALMSDPWCDRQANITLFAAAAKLTDDPAERVRLINIFRREKDKKKRKNEE